MSVIIQAPYPGTQSVLRAVALLKAFTDARPELSLTELARTAGLNKTTAYRMLTALEAEGMVLRSTETGGYRLGPGAIDLGGRALRANSLRALAHPELQRLAAETGETASLEVLAGAQAMVLDEVLGPHLVGSVQSIGTSWPAHATSTGLAILAYLDDARREATLAGPLARLNTRTITDRGKLDAALEQVRRAGYATALDQIEDDYAAVGAPVFSFDREPVAAISVGGPSSRLSAAKIKDAALRVVAAAGRVSTQLGYRP
jgi:IclR family acetate operon transcriptional repressor